MPLDKVEDDKVVSTFQPLEDPTQVSQERVDEVAELLSPKYDTEGLELVTDPSIINQHNDYINTIEDDSLASNLKDFGISAIQGITFGTGDEILDFFGNEQYSKALDVARERSPWLSIAGEIAGAIPWFIVPSAGFVRAGSIAAKTGGSAIGAGSVPRTALQRKLYDIGYTAGKSGPLGRLATSAPVVYGAEGATYGGLYGFAEGDDTHGDRLAGATTGALLGGGLVGGVVLGGKAIGAAYRGAKGLTQQQLISRLPIAQKVALEENINDFVNNISNRPLRNQEKAAAGFEKYDPNTKQFTDNRPFDTTLNSLFRSPVKPGDNWIAPSYVNSYKALDNLEVYTKDGNIEIKQPARVALTKTQAGDLSVLPKKLREDIESATTLSLGDTAQVKSYIKKLLANEEVTLNHKEYVKIIKNLEDDLKTAADKYNIRPTIDSIEDYHRKYAELFNSELATKLLVSPQAAKRFVSDLSKGKQLSEGTIKDFLRLTEWAKKTIPDSQGNFGTKAQRLRIDNILTETKAEVVASLLDNLPNARKVLKSRNAKGLKLLLGESDFKKFEELVGDMEELAAGSNRGLGVNTSLLLGAGGFAYGGFSHLIIGTILPYATNAVWKKLTKELTLGNKPQSKQARQLLKKIINKRKGRSYTEDELNKDVDIQQFRDLVQQLTNNNNPL